MTDDELKMVFRELVGEAADPYPYQLEVARHLLAGRSVILRAPTGAGKTFAALLPYLAAHKSGAAFPRRMLHAAPLRTLVEQFAAKLGQLLPELDTRCQTGVRPDDPELRADVSYLTIDQLLASFLGIGRAESSRVSSAYIVLDEIHLYEPETALATTLEMLTWVNGRTPFLIMTATMSSSLLRELARAINPTRDPDREVAVVEAGEVAGSGQRTIHTALQPLAAASVLRRHRDRTIVVCNTVARAQLIYQRLLAWGRSEENTLLLHGRFKATDRGRITHEVMRHFGKDAGDQDIILVATQVVEVGLDISCRDLHTEVAPASSITQRAGRCARFPGEAGRVYVYPLQENVSGRVSYLPYDHDLSQRTLSVLPSYEGAALDYRAAGGLVDQVHSIADERILLAIELGRATRREQMRRTLFGMTCWRDAREQLIRRSSGLRFILCDQPQMQAKLDTFSLPRSLLTRLLVGGATVLWRTGKDGTAEWRMVKGAVDIERGELFALPNSSLARYSPTMGLTISTQSGYSCTSRPRIKQVK